MNELIRPYEDKDHDACAAMSLMVAEDQMIYHRVDEATHVTDIYVHGFRMNL